jgi:hypothetical protein
MLCPKTKVHDHGEAGLCAVGGEVYVLVDKEAINCQIYSLLKLDELFGNHDNALQHAFAISSHCIPFHL